jgi:hypothetical protein
MMTTPKEVVSIRVYVLTERETRSGFGATELEDRGAEAVELVGTEAADPAELGERSG